MTKFTVFMARFLGAFTVFAVLLSAWRLWVDARTLPFAETAKSLLVAIGMVVSLAGLTFNLARNLPGESKDAFELSYAGESFLLSVMFLIEVIAWTFLTSFAQASGWWKIVSESFSAFLLALMFGFAITKFGHGFEALHRVLLRRYIGRVKANS